MGRNSTKNKVILTDINCLDLELTPAKEVPVLAAVTDGHLINILGDQLGQAQVDSSGLVKVILKEHDKRHIGENFHATVDTTGTSASISFRVASGTIAPHMSFLWKTENDATLEVWKGSTWTTGTGTDLTPNNSNDNLHGVVTSNIQGDAGGSFVSDRVTQDVTGLNTGSARLLFKESVWGTNQAPASGTQGGRDEQILEPGTTYTYIVTAVSGGIWLHLDWYEQEMP